MAAQLKKKITYQLLNYSVIYARTWLIKILAIGNKTGGQQEKKARICTYNSTILSICTIPPRAFTAISLKFDPFIIFSLPLAEIEGSTVVIEKKTSSKCKGQTYSHLNGHL